MCDRTGWIVRALAGHDKGLLFCVMGQTEDGRLLLVNGKQRKLDHPKKKKLGHVAVEDPGTFRDPVLHKLRTHRSVTNRELRRALAAFKGR